MRLLARMPNGCVSQGRVSESRIGQSAREIVCWAGKSGVTFDLRTNEVVGAIDAWAVSLRGAERSVGCLLTARSVFNYLRTHYAALTRIDGAYFGAWRDPSGTWRFDLTRIVVDVREAMLLGIAHGQDAIHHFGRHETRWLNDYAWHRSLHVVAPAPTSRWKKTPGSLPAPLSD